VTGVGTFAIKSFMDKSKEAKLENSNSYIEENINTSESNKDTAINIDDFIEVDTKNGYITSIEPGATEKEVLENNVLITSKNEGFTLEELLKTKNLAENFAQSMALYDSSNPNKYVDIAKRYADKSVDNIFLRIPTFSSKGAQENTKRMEIRELYSHLEEYKADKKIFIYEIDVAWTWIDNYDRVASQGETKYYVNIKEIDDEYKVYEYFID
ncbi:MAG: hypothetical protein ACRC68_03195, partial [Clostridium sp.]